MQSRLGELGLQSIDVGGADDCFFRSVSLGPGKFHVVVLVLPSNRISTAKQKINLF